MGLRPSQKPSEAGLIPEDWITRPIKAIATVKGGKRLPRGRMLQEAPTPHPYVRVTDMRPGGVDVSDIKYVPSDVFPTIKNYRIFREDIFISVAGTLGIVGKIPAALDGANLTENADRITDIRCDRDYLLYSLASERIQKLIDSSRTVGAQPKLALGKIESFVIPLPPTDAEQRAIAAALSDVDAVLTQLDQLIAKKRDLKQAAMQHLLSGEIRLPGYTSQCRTVQLAELGTWVGGATPSMKNPTYWTDGDVPWISSGDVKHPLSFSSLRMITRRAVVETATKVLPAQSLILVTRSGILRHTLPIALVPSPVSINQDIKGLIPKSGVYGPFVLQALLESAPRILGTCLKAGTTVESIEFRWLKRFQIRLPAESEQRATADVLSDMDAELNALEARRDKTRQLKQGMMQALLTGRIRIK